MHKKAFVKLNLIKNYKLKIKDLIFLRSEKSDGLKRLDFYGKKIILKKNLLKGELLKKSYCRINGQKN